LLGAELNLFLNTGKNEFVATVDTRMDANVGNKVDLVFDLKHMHIFDKETTRAIR